MAVKVVGPDAHDLSPCDRGKLTHDLLPVIPLPIPEVTWHMTCCTKKQKHWQQVLADEVMVPGPYACDPSPYIRGGLSHELMHEGTKRLQSR